MNIINISYTTTPAGSLKMVPKGKTERLLTKNYAAMLADKVIMGNPLSFDKLLEICADLETKINSHIMTHNDDINSDCQLSTRQPI